VIESLAAVVVTSFVLGDEVTTKLADVALTYSRIPFNAPPALSLTVPVIVLVKPTPVKATTVPTGAPTTIAVGNIEVIDGPATYSPSAKESCH